MHRLRRLRKSKAMRDLVAQTNLKVSNMVMPYFVCEGNNIKQPIKSMPGIFRFSQGKLLKDIEEAKRLGINSVILFGIPKDKDDKAAGAYKEDGVIQKAASALKRNFADDLIVITDVCLCAYTSQGHCGILKAVDSLSFIADGKQKNKSYQPSTINYQQVIDNDETIKILAKIALSHARSGADIVAPSAMMDGQVASIREGLDKNGFINTAIMSYSVKFNSSFYGPFREAAESMMKFGDRKSYQMDYRNSDEALREIELDIQEGADIVMVKPALSYLDIVVRAKEKFSVPLAAYNVSGEYAMVKAYAQITDDRAQRTETEKELAIEILTSIKRAGADIIITYWAKDMAKWIK